MPAPPRGAAALPGGAGGGAGAVGPALVGRPPSAARAVLEAAAAGGAADAAGGPAAADSLAAVGVGGLPLSNALSSASKSISLRSLSSSRRTCAAPSSNSGSAARTSVVFVRPCVPDEFRPLLRARALHGRAARECAIIVIALIVSSRSKGRRYFKTSCVLWVAGDKIYRRRRHVSSAWQASPLHGLARFGFGIDPVAKLHSCIGRYTRR